MGTTDRGEYALLAQDDARGERVTVVLSAAPFGDPAECAMLLRELVLLRRCGGHAGVLALHEVLPPPRGEVAAWRDVLQVRQHLEALCEYAATYLQPSQVRYSASGRRGSFGRLSPLA